MVIREDASDVYTRGLMLEVIAEIRSDISGSNNLDVDHHVGTTILPE